MTDQRKSNDLYFGGMPTGPDIEELMEQIPPHSMEPGTTYGHDDLARIIGVLVSDRRFHTVTRRWRKKLLADHNIDTIADPGIGFRVLHDHERVSVGLGDAKRARKATGKAAQRIDRADRANLNEHQRAQADHAVRLLSAQFLSMRDAEKQVARAGKVVALPRSAKG